MNFDPIEHRIFEGISGSKLYGTATEYSDTDTRGICIQPLDVRLDPFQNFEQKDSFGDEDRVIYDFGKWLTLCADGNPNIIELLFVPQSMTLFSTPQWQYVVQNRELFLSKKVAKTFAGYAFSQLKRLERHREWFTNPLGEKPTREDYGLNHHSSIVTEAVLQNLAQVPNNFLKDEVLEELNAERAYRDAKKRWEDYRRWLTERNPKRRETEQKFGYDTKFAAHVLRLIEEGMQLLLNHEIVFPLHNAKLLLEIRNGGYTYEEMLSHLNHTNGFFSEWESQSTLPNKPDVNALRELYFKVIGSWYFPHMNEPLDIHFPEENDECIEGYRMDDER